MVRFRRPAAPTALRFFRDFDWQPSPLCRAGEGAWRGLLVAGHCWPRCSWLVIDAALSAPRPRLWGTGGLGGVGVFFVLLSAAPSRRRATPPFIGALRTTVTDELGRRTWAAHPPLRGGGGAGLHMEWAGRGAGRPVRAGGGAPWWGSASSCFGVGWRRHRLLVGAWGAEKLDTRSRLRPGSPAGQAPAQRKACFQLVVP